MKLPTSDVIFHVADEKSKHDEKKIFTAEFKNPSRNLSLIFLQVQICVSHFILDYVSEPQSSMEWTKRSSEVKGALRIYVVPPQSSSSHFGSTHRPREHWTGTH
jgi:hypothetical protein